ncbi:MAG: hypothetical protein IID41_05450, partial [Planctomycetes bacterium]|nr:hypothetical protein [Planctomycetota bacterium]
SERQIDKDHFTHDDVDTEIAEDPCQDQTRDERSREYLKHGLFTP